VEPDKPSKACVDNVIIAPDGDDSIIPGSANDVIWGAPQTDAIDDYGDRLDGAGSILDLSGTASGTTKLYGNSIQLEQTVGPTVTLSSGQIEKIPELDIVNGSNKLKSFYITTIVGGNGLDALDLSLEDTVGKSNSINITNNGGGDTITDSDGLNIVAVGFDTIDFGIGNDTINSDVIDLTLNFGNGANDTLTHAGPGSVAEAGLGSDTFDISNDVLITGAGPQDRIAYDGNDVFGALAWNSTQGGWAYNDYGYGVGYGINKLGDLVIKTPGANPALMYLANYVGGPGVPVSEETAHIFVGVASEGAYRLLGPHPNVDFVWSQFNLANAMFKVDTGYSYWLGADPLVLDLTGNGLDLIGESDVSPIYDIYKDGFAVHTGWVKPDDGLLVWDDNGAYQLLGSNGISGFAALATAAGINLLTGR
jgi:hypothetical protein